MTGRGLTSAERAAVEAALAQLAAGAPLGWTQAAREAHAWAAAVLLEAGAPLHAEIALRRIAAGRYAEAAEILRALLAPEAP